MVLRFDNIDFYTILLLLLFVLAFLLLISYLVSIGTLYGINMHLHLLVNIVDHGAQ